LFDEFDVGKCSLQITLHAQITMVLQYGNRFWVAN